uniref:Uncharacterized protein n=1 Tax=Setaria digitata TaxID=48799 RepID=A0A915PXX8_9BILA
MLFWLIGVKEGKAIGNRPSDQNGRFSHTLFIFIIKDTENTPQDASNRIQYLRQLPSFANESCDRVKNSLPVVSCHGSFCIKLVIINPSSFSRQICEPGPAIVRDCWSRVMWTDLDKNTFRKIIQEGSSKIGETGET